MCSFEDSFSEKIFRSQLKCFIRVVVWEICLSDRIDCLACLFIVSTNRRHLARSHPSAGKTTYATCSNNII